MLYEKADDEFGHMLELHGVFHHIMISPCDDYRDDNANWLLLTVGYPEKSVTLDQEDINELHEFLGRYVNVEASQA